MNTFYTILITLVVYSLISTVIFIISRENENILYAFGLGFIGFLLLIVIRIIHKIVELFKYHIGKRSIFEEESNGSKFKCRTADTDDILWDSDYKLLKRYAKKTEWINIPDFSKGFIENSKRNCNRCKYDKECEYPYKKAKCKHDRYGTILEFDKFEKK